MWQYKVYADISQRFPGEGVSNDNVDYSNFQFFRWLFLETLEIMSAFLYGFVGFLLIPKQMPLNGHFTLNFVFCHVRVEDLFTAPCYLSVHVACQKFVS